MKNRGLSKHRNKILVSIVLILMLLGMCALAIYGFNQSDGEKLIVPDIEYVIDNGYPKNERGETYGPNIEGKADPDLLLAEGQDGTVGYIRQKEMLDVADSVQEALMSKPQNKEINLYLQDGSTVIGTFIVEKGNAYEKKE